MQNTIHHLLEDLGNAFAGQIKAANDNANAAQAELAQIKNGLRLLVGLPSETHAEATQFTPVVIDTEKRTVRSGRKNTLSDSAFKAVLNTKWATAAQIRAALMANGNTISEGTTYNRMRKLTANCPDVVEGTTKPERWRLKFKPDGQKDRETPAVEATTPSKLAIESATAEKTLAANDNPVTFQTPQLHHGDCLTLMKGIADHSVDLILADLPYGTTRCAWDHPIPLDLLWAEYRRILKPTGAVVLFGSQPFTTELAASNRDWFKYALVWEKTTATGFHHARNKPLKSHEDILVFSPGTTISASRSKRRMTYNPQGAITTGMKRAKGGAGVRYLGDLSETAGRQYEAISNCPRSVLKFPKDAHNVHPFQKPAALLEYLIKTFSNENDVVLDNTMGGGGTCIAAMRTNRASIGIELDRKWFDIATARVFAEAVSAGNDNERTPEPPIQPVVATRSLTLYQGDCLDVMRGMPSGSVDLIFTSPPYNLGVSSGGGMRNSVGTGRWKNAALANGYASYDDARDPRDYIAWQKEFLIECWRLLSPTGAIFYQHKPRGQNKVLQTPLDLNPGLPVRQIIIWNRNNGFNFNNSYFLSTHEWITVFAKPDFRLTDEGKRLKDVWTIKPERNNPHPAPFPVELPLTAIEATNAKVILDPFMGSGTTGVAALRCGREFIGIELDPGYLKDAHERIRMEGLAIAA